MPLLSVRLDLAQINVKHRKIWKYNKVWKIFILLGYPNKLRQYCQWNPKRCERFFKYRWPIVLCRSNCAESVLWGRHSFKNLQISQEGACSGVFFSPATLLKEERRRTFFPLNFSEQFFYITPPSNCCMWHLFVTDFIGMVLFNSILILWFLFSINDGEEIC